MKVYKRIISCVLLICITLFISLGVSAESIDPTDEVSGTILRNFDSTLGYSKLFESFNLSASPASPVYPDCYGGAYIDETGILVIQTTDLTYASEKNRAQFNVATLKEVTGLKQVETETVKYSYNQLLSSNSIISDILLDNTKYDLDKTKYARLDRNSLDFEIAMCGIDAKNNSVVVWLDDISDKTIQTFRTQIIDVPYLSFKLAPKVKPTQEASYKSGQGGINGGSIGYPATKGSDFGFVTAWHCTDDGTNYLGSQAYGPRVGSSTYDYAFVKNNGSSHTISRGLYDVSKTLAAGGYSYPVQGSAIGRTGSASGYDFGSVIATSVTVPGLGSDLYKTDCYSLRGDSGGPYFTSPSNSTVYLSGIHLGGYNGQIEGTYFRGVWYMVEAGYRI